MSSENLAVSDNLKEEKRSKSPEAKVCSVPKMNVVFNGGIDISGIVVIKAQLKDEIRRVPLHNEELTYAELVLMLQRMFKGGLKTDDDITIKYKDEDGDLVTITDDSDVAFAIQSSRVLNLKVVFNKGEERDKRVVGVGELRGELTQIREKVDRILNFLEVEEGEKKKVSTAGPDGDKKETIAKPSPEVTKAFDPLQHQVTKTTTEAASHQQHQHPPPQVNGSAPGVGGGFPTGVMSSAPPPLQPQQPPVRQQPQGGTAPAAAQPPPSMAQPVAPPPTMGQQQQPQARHQHQQQQQQQQQPPMTYQLQQQQQPQQLPPSAFPPTNPASQPQPIQQQSSPQPPQGMSQGQQHQHPPMSVTPGSQSNVQSQVPPTGYPMTSTPSSFAGYGSSSYPFNAAPTPYGAPTPVRPQTQQSNQPQASGPSPSAGQGQGGYFPQQQQQQQPQAPQQFAPPPMMYPPPPSGGAGPTNPYTRPTGPGMYRPPQ